MGAVLGLFVWSDAQWFVSPEYRKDDSRAAVACLRGVIQPEATVAVAPGFMAPVLPHYAARGHVPLHVVGVNEAEDLPRAPGAAALLLTRLHHVRDPASLRRAFADTAGEPRVWGEVIGYHIYVADPAVAGRAAGCAP